MEKIVIEELQSFVNDNYNYFDQITQRIEEKMDHSKEIKDPSSNNFGLITLLF